MSDEAWPIGTLVRVKQHMRRRPGHEGVVIGQGVDPRTGRNRLRVQFDRGGQSNWPQETLERIDDDLPSDGSSGVTVIKSALTRTVAATKLLLATQLIRDARRDGAMLAFDIEAAVGAEANRMFLQLEREAKEPT